MDRSCQLVFGADYRSGAKRPSLTINRSDVSIVSAMHKFQSFEYTCLNASAGKRSILFSCSEFV